MRKRARNGKGSAALLKLAHQPFRDALDDLKLNGADITDDRLTSLETSERILSMDNDVQFLLKADHQAEKPVAQLDFPRHFHHVIQDKLGMLDRELSRSPQCQQSPSYSLTSIYQESHQTTPAGLE